MSHGLLGLNLNGPERPEGADTTASEGRSHGDQGLLGLNLNNSADGKASQEAPAAEQFALPLQSDAQSGGEEAFYYNRSEMFADPPPDHSVPILLMQMQDELARARRRESLWMSLVTHIVVIFLLLTAPKWMPSGGEVIEVSPARDKELTYLALPPDLQKPKVRPNTNVISDKDRIATSRRPVDRQARQILDAAKPGPPGAPGLRAQAPPAPPELHNTPAPPAQQAQASTPPALQNVPQVAQPAQAQSQPRVTFGSNSRSAGDLIRDATRAAAQSRGGGIGGMGGEYGPAPGDAEGRVGSDLDILSDTQGVDFGPYLQRVLNDVRRNWYTLIPEVARAPLLKRGKVSIEFAILKDGRVAGMRIVGQSGDLSLDRAAYGGITASNPFPPLPTEFKGEYLALRFHFFYNPDRNDLH